MNVGDQRGNITIASSVIHNCGFNGAYFDANKSLTITDSEFSNNCQQHQWGWGLFCQGVKDYRTPQASGGPNWNSYNEYYVYGTPQGKVDIRNSKFNNNGLYGQYGSGGLWLSSMNKDHITLAGNQALNNHGYGVALIDSEWNLKDNAEFTSLTGNYYALTAVGYRDTLDPLSTYRSNKCTITNYNISACYGGVIGWDTHLTVNNSNVHDNEMYGVLLWNGYATMNNLTATNNTYGFHGAYNLGNSLTKCNLNTNKQHGAYIYVYDSWLGASRPYTLTMDSNTANGNGSCGIITQAYHHTSAGGLTPALGTLYSINNSTCNNNQSYGILMYHGWLDVKTGSDNTCNGS